MMLYNKLMETTMTTINMTDPIASHYVAASVLKGHIRLMSVGLKCSFMSNQAALDKASELTGETYSSRRKADYTRAITDLVNLMEAILKAKEEGGQ